MATTQQMLSAINQMQPNAQAALPVIPNNGNPAGANNMPQTIAAPVARPGMPNLSWLQPSPSMQMFQQQLAARQPLLDQQRTMQAQSAVAPQQSVVQPKPMMVAPPVLPRQGVGAVLPQEQQPQQAVLPQLNSRIRQFEP